MPESCLLDNTCNVVDSLRQIPASEINRKRQLLKQWGRRLGYSDHSGEGSNGGFNDVSDPDAFLTTLQEVWRVARTPAQTTWTSDIVTLHDKPQPRCGHEDGRCNCIEWSQHCNDATGWCGDSDEYKSASSGKYDCSTPPPEIGKGRRIRKLRHNNATTSGGGAFRSS